MATQHRARPRDRQVPQARGRATLFSTSLAQTYALVRRGDLRAIKLGGRGQWRVELAEIDAFVERAYAETAEYIRAHPVPETSEALTAVDDGFNPGDGEDAGDLDPEDGPPRPTDEDAA